MPPVPPAPMGGASDPHPASAIPSMAASVDGAYRGADMGE
ncbi:Hypothetical protein A7982_00198 [Minicystis rosea]|nr:Hypothetical protein A7982_00198 [Minicystis rosea]